MASKLENAFHAAAAALMDGVYEQIRDMIRALWASRQKNRIFGLAAALIAVVAATAYSQVKLNAWNQPFYDALSRKDVPAFVGQLGVFGVLAGVLLVLNVAQTRLNQTTKVVLRQGLVDDLMNAWMAPGRAFRLSNAGEIGANPDQRIQQDAGHLTDLTTDLGIGLLQSSLLLLSFVGVLWGLSDAMAFTLAGQRFAIPGYMVWCALLYAGAASLASGWVGRPLVGLNAEHYAREADFRAAIVRVSEAIDGVTLIGGERDERIRLADAFAGVLDVSRRLVWASMRLTWVTAGYGWFTILAPILVAAPAYFQSRMTFGELMMIVGAFNQVQQALRWFVDNFSNIADWRATLLRVASFRKAMFGMDELGRVKPHIEFQDGAEDSVRFDSLRIAGPAGCIALEETRVSLAAGERAFVTGETAEARALFFRTLGGLWPWGTGRIVRPSGRVMMFLPAQAYVPPGPLSEAVAYPHACDRFEDAAIERALAAVGLDGRAPQAAGPERWDRWLNDEEKQRLAFARVLLHRPRWLVLDEILEILDPVWRDRIVAILRTDLAGMGVIDVGREAVDPGFIGRTLRLVVDPKGPALAEVLPQAAASPSSPDPFEKAVA